MTLEPRHLVILSKARLLKNLSDMHRRMLLDAMKARELSPGEVLFAQGDHGDAMAILVEGSLGIRIQRSDSDLEELVTLRAGAVVGEMACLDPARRSATVVAKEGCTVLLLARDTLEDLTTSAPAVAAALVGGAILELANRLRETNTRIEEAQRAAGLPSPEPTDLSEIEVPRGEPLPAGIRIDLSRVPLLRGMTPKDLDLLTSVAPPKAFPVNTVLCREGTVGSACYLLLEGEVKVIRATNEGEDSLATLTPPTLVGQLSLIDKFPRSATVRAHGAIIAQQLHRDDFERLLAAASPLGLRFQRQLAVAGIRQLRMANTVLSKQVSALPVQSTDVATDPATQRRRLVYVQAALSEWNLPLEDLEEISDLIEITADEDTADLTELFDFQELTDLDLRLPTAEIEISAIPADQLLP